MDIKKLVAQMTLEEKAGMCSGADFWHTKAVERLGIPSVMLSDGPHGLRKQADEADHLGINDSIKAVCFPAGCAMASSYDRDLIQTIGEALGDECQAENLSVILGPAACIKRSPLCGRNFEYFSEDPFLSTEIATSHIKGVQSKNVGTSLKHYLANNQEYRRMTSSSEVDERTLREIYLATFEGAVKNAKPWTVMCSYNQINGVFASENEEYLTKVLRDEWGFEGYVVSDWGAVNERVAGVIAGLDLEMPASGGVNDAKIVAAVNNGTMDEAILDKAVERILTIVYKYIENKQDGVVFDYEGDHALSRKAAGECAVLLKNDGILPLAKSGKTAFIGEFAKTPRYQGGGSSHINAFKTTSALDAADGVGEIIYAQGYQTRQDTIEQNLIDEAVEAARNADRAVIFAGLPDSFESEGYDRTHMRMPDCQNMLIEAVAAVQPNTIVVLHNGSPVEMPWVDNVKAILELYLGGQAVGGAAIDILFGDVNPSGKLAETFPVKLEDNPSFLYYVGEKDVVEYREGVFVGYRYYDTKKMDVLFPFGHGLSYTSFEYSNIKIGADRLKDTDTLNVSFDVKNTGAVAGKEVVQLYVADRDGIIIRPTKELKGFDKVSLAPGETKTVSFTLDKRAFAYWNTTIHDWHVESGDFDILIGASSRDIRLSATVYVESTVSIPGTFTINSTLGDIMAHPKGMQVFAPVFEPMQAMFGGGGESEAASSAITDEMTKAMMDGMPLRALLSFGGGALNEDILKMLLAQLD